MCTVLRVLWRCRICNGVLPITASYTNGTPRICPEWMFCADRRNPRNITVTHKSETKIRYECDKRQAEEQRKRGQDFDRRQIDRSIWMS
jgi:hypothetical protein